ncbi:cytochrome P450 [Thermomonospora cellulosilytica]|uniref:Cytochrome P450 n=1 Tax=Thermomonospora cellulosilytica TaxID=1411118 RepID=A0A7W3N0Z4_9ACTN|nr:cytochrome P450 [Thermomonospora cellulosilytica]MBA9005544.1 cytochrome P450 [Thermomonospora cellulosilytica]
MTETTAPEIDFNPFDPAYRADPYPYYHRLRERAPIYRNPLGHWLLSRYRDCTAVLRDDRFGHGSPDLLRENTFRKPVEGRARPFILLDPPEHTRLRSLVNKAFTPRTVRRLAPRIQELVDQMLDEMIDAGEVDFMEAFAYPLPVTVISEMLGVPAADRDAVRELSHIVARSVDPDFRLSEEDKRARDEAFARFDDYFRELVAERRRRPADDLLTNLVTVHEDGERLTEAELLTTCILLYVAGHETTTDLLGNGTLALSRNPDQFHRLRTSPGLAESAVEELLRYDPPTQMSRRTALTDADVNGHPIAAGEQVVILRGAANRDPEVFPDPDRLDLGRMGNRHLSFDGGIHYCLGAPLARLEGAIAFATITRRLRHVETTTDTLRYRDNLIIRGLAELPVRLRS